MIFTRVYILHDGYDAATADEIRGSFTSALTRLVQGWRLQRGAM